MKSIVVVGAYGGMGRATVLKLVENGYEVYALDKIVKEKEDHIHPIICDVTNIDSINEAYELVHKETDDIYAIIHFVGIYYLDSLIEITKEKYENIYKINVFGPYLINKTFLPLLKKGSRIIITTSELATLDPLPFTGLYAITKGALDKYSYSLAMELALLDINVSVIRPGAVKTEMLNVSTNELDEFCNNLWKNREKIQKGTYKWNNSEYNAYSYESKICFLINPEYYKLIYDGNVRKALNKATKDNWQDKADKYYQNNNNKEKIPFEIDWTLWLEGSKK